MGLFADLTMGSPEFLSLLFVFIIGVVVLMAVILFFININQTEDAISSFSWGPPSMACVRKMVLSAKRS